jgi:hypothetical protein
MKIKRIIEKPFHRYEVKKLPKDAEYVQHSINDEEIYYSKAKQAYYVVTK